MQEQHDRTDTNATSNVSATGIKDYVSPFHSNELMENLLFKVLDCWVQKLQI